MQDKSDMQVSSRMQRAWEAFLQMSPLTQGLVLLGVWFLVGMVPMMLYRFDVARSGPFGDTFGTSNSFFACLTLGVVLLSLHEQRKANQKTVELAEKTALLQSLTFMAEFNADLMNGVKDTALIAKYRNAAEQFIDRASKIMEQLGEQIPKVGIDNLHSDAADILDEILTRYRADVSGYVPGAPADELMASARIAVRELAKWNDNYAASLGNFVFEGVFRTDTSVKVLGQCSDNEWKIHQRQIAYFLEGFPKKIERAMKQLRGED